MKDHQTPIKLSCPHFLIFSNASSCQVKCLMISLCPPLQVVYFEVGNLNTNAFPAAANLPTYVRENYGFASHHGNQNMDRIIISFQVQTRVVETVYVTEHDGRGCGQFSPNRTYEISCELIQALQNPQLDITTFLTQMGYYTSIQCQQLGHFMEPLNYDQLLHYSLNLPSQNSRLVANYRDVQAAWRPNASSQHYWPTGRVYQYTGKGAVSLCCSVYLAAVCISAVRLLLLYCNITGYSD